MIITRAWHEFIHIDSYYGIARLIEQAGRTCYKSESNMTTETAETFCRSILKSGHLSVIEHAAATVRIICDRGVSHELVRHRIASFSQESTRYANYAGGKFGRQISVILPLWYDGIIPTGCYATGELAIQEQQLYDRLDAESRRAAHWLSAVLAAEAAYLSLIENGAAPQEARAVLPNSLKTEIVMTANLRQWKHILGQRCGKACHPQMREVMLRLLEDFYNRVPVVFHDEWTRYIAGREVVHV